jgi:hypothetical protein
MWTRWGVPQCPRLLHSMGNCIDAMARTRLVEGADIGIYDLSQRYEAALAQRASYTESLPRGQPLTPYQATVIGRMNAEIDVVKTLLKERTTRDTRATKQAVAETLSAVSRSSERARDKKRKGPDVFTMRAKLDAEHRLEEQELKSMLTLLDDEQRLVVEPVYEGDEDTAVASGLSEEDDDGLTPRAPPRRALVAM